MASPSGTIIGIDFGEARIGVAASDDMGMFAHPLETIHVSKTDPVKRIAKLVSQKKASTLVIGQPLRMDGSEGTAVKKVRAFVNKLKKELPKSVSVVEIDERLTTKEAEELLAEAGRKAGKQKGKGKGKAADPQDLIDQAAAALILQDFLDNASESDDEDAEPDEIELTSASDSKDDLVAFRDDFEDEDEFATGLGGGWGDDDEDDDY